MIQFLKRHRLWLGFGAALVPMLLLLGVQYRWLVRLQDYSMLAHKAVLGNYLDTIGAKTRHHYLWYAEELLDLPADAFLRGDLGEIESYWRNFDHKGVRRLFVVDFTHVQFGNFLAFDPDSGRLAPLPASTEAMAIIMACTPWQVQTYRGGPAEMASLRVEEGDPANRILLNAILEESSRVVGVAGMILDEGYFAGELLPAAVRKALPEALPSGSRKDVVVTVRDALGRVVYESGKGDAETTLITRPLPFVFTDWTLSVHAGRSTPEQWARASFAYNMTLAALLALVLVAGVAMALRTADRAIRLSEMKSDFVSNVSHELRTPLASIRVFAEFLKLGRATTPEKVQEYGEYIDVESRRLSRLIDNILDFSRIESGRKTYSFAPADLHDIVASALRTFEVRLRQDGFHVEFDAGGWQPVEMPLDRDAVGQAVANLLDNAIKYSGASRAIQVRLRREDGTAVVEVQDGGIGIEPEEQRKIFERFHRVGSSLVHDVKGSGLGLSIVHHVVQAHEGQVTVESTPGKGSLFAIRLPLVRRPPGQTA